jgi:hypothetical protein
MNDRRKLLIALGTTALAAPFGSFAQQPGKVWRVGLLYVLSRQSSEDRNRAFLEATAGGGAHSKGN